MTQKTGLQDCVALTAQSMGALCRGECGFPKINRMTLVPFQELCDTFQERRRTN